MIYESFFAARRDTDNTLYLESIAPSLYADHLGEGNLIVLSETRDADTFILFVLPTAAFMEDGPGLRAAANEVILLQRGTFTALTDFDEHHARALAAVLPQGEIEYA
jgi:hypothetical protein